ncbi:MAG: VWA domain-containing protein [Ruminococcus sp.]|nr:VWA domain-containing protein [Ruminococcus sp.]
MKRIRSKKRFNRKRWLRTAGSSVLAIVLVVALMLGLMPGDALAAEKVSDLDTSTKYTESLGNDASTEYSGRIWTDKSVYSGESASFTMYGGKTATVENDSDFLVAYSALATGQEVQGQTTAPVDVVFVIDISGSMSNPSSGMDNGKSRIYNTVQAVNDSIDEIMAMNDQSRVAVVAFSGNSEVLLPLDRYTKVGNTSYFSVSKQGPGSVLWDGSWEEVFLYTSATGSDGTIRKTTQVTGGTNIQMGFYEGLNVLLEERDTVATVGGTEVKRVPSLILLSDGTPTFSSDSEAWWAPSDNHNDGAGSRGFAGNGFKAMMTASYMKDAVDRHYGVTGTTSASTIYTIGMGISQISNYYSDEYVRNEFTGEQDIAYITLNPEDNWNMDSTIGEEFREYWSEYTARNNTGTTEVNVGVWGERSPGQWAYIYDGYTVKHPNTGYDVDSINDYVDSYYDADTADEVTDVFSKIVSSISISAAEAPTEIKGNDPMTDGYITYTDPIGEYMEVKDVKEILYAGTEFTQQTKVVSEDKLTTTYTFTGEVHSPVYGDQNIDDIIIVVTKDSSTGNETMTIKIPASVIPMRVNSIVLNPDGTVKSNTSNGAYPVRVLYTVGLQEDIIKDGVVQTTELSEEYIAKNTDEDGNINFYSNLYTGTNEVNGRTAGDTTVEFEPAHTNSFYYMQDDIALYYDKELTRQVSASEALADGTTYYYKETYYQGTSIVDEVISRTGAQLKQTELKNIGGYWYRAEGSLRINRILEFEGKKSANSTATAQDFYAPTFVYGADGTDAYEGKFVIYLGNNGVLSAPATGMLEISKEVVIPDGSTPDTDSFQFKVDFNGDKDLEGSFDYEAVDSEGKIVSSGTITDGGTITLEDGWTVKIKNLPPGTTYKVTETEVAGFTSENDGDTTGEIKAGETSREEFTNTYAVEPVTYPAEGTFGGTKILKGRNWDSEVDTYTFFLTPYNNAPLPEGYDAAKGVTVTEAVDNEAEFVFGSIEFTKPGIYRYTIVEKEPENDKYLPGMTYSRALYNVVITVTDNGDGTLSAEADVQKLYTDGAEPLFTYDAENNIVMNAGQEAQDEVVFTNTYSAEDVVRVPVATKTYTDNSGEKPLVSGMFEFEMSPLGEVGSDGKVIEGTSSKNPMPLDEDGNKLTSVITENEGQNITFLPVTFTHEDIPEGQDSITFRYQMKEVLPEEATEDNDYTVNGMKYDPTVYEIDVTVSVDANSNALIINAVYPNDERIVNFENSYTPESVTVKLEGTKTLNGRDMKAGEEFEFTWGVRDNDAFTSDALRNYTDTSKIKTEAAVSGGKDGKGVAFDLGELTFTRPGTYKFYIKEAAGEAKGVTYDTVKKYVTVTVTDNNGKLEASVVYDNGTVSADTEKAVFVNTYESTFDTETAVSLEGTKNLTGKSLVAGEFYFEVEDVKNNSKVLSTHIADEEATEGVYSGSITLLDNVTYTEAGEYVYYIREQIPDSKVGGTTYDESLYRYTVTVTDDGEGRLYVSDKKLEISEDNGNNWRTAEAVVFDNSYEPAPLEITVSPMTKILSGSRAAAIEAGEFKFEMSLVSADPEDGITLPTPAVVENDANGKINFGKIKFTKAGTYTVKVKEIIPKEAVKNEDGTYTLNGITYSTEEITATYKVTDDRNGKLTAVIESSTGGRTFTNTYESEGELNLTIKKDFTGRTDDAWLDSDEFEFEVVVLDPATQAAIEAGDVVFPTEGEDKHIQTLKIDAKDSDKAIDSPNIVVKRAGTYKFVVREITGSIAGVNYDSTAHEITVTANDNNKGGLNISLADSADSTVSIENNIITFNNVYDKDSTELSGHDNLKITKEFTGRENEEWLETDAFTFVLEAGDPTTQAAIDANKADTQKGIELPETTLVVTNANKAYPHFGNIIFHEAGTYTFNIREVIPEGAVENQDGTYTLNGITYDSDVKTIVVEVTDNNEGELVAALTADSDSLTFSNKYAAKEAELDCTANLSLTKELSGRDWMDGDSFTFTLEATGDTLDAVEDGDVVLPETTEATITASDFTGANTSERVDAFVGKITFKKVGTYTFAVKETAGNIDGITYDPNNVIVTVHVTDKDANGLPTGQLSASVSYSSGEKITFTNTYTPDPVKAELTGEKVLTGGYELKAGDFHFSISAVTEGAPMPAVKTAVNGVGEDTGAISFGEITYTQAGTYEYEITETRGTIEGVTYDTGKVTATVEVTYDSVTGKFNTPTVSYEKVGGNGGEGFTFTNTYKGTPAELSGSTALKVTKNFTGRTNDKWLGTDKFVFELAAYDDVTKAAVEDNASNVSAGIKLPETTLEITAANKENASFGNITFYEEGTFTFVVTEKESGITGVTDDADKDRIITVKVTDNKAGKLVVTQIAESSEALIFNNVYNASGTVGFEVTKELSGRDWFASDSFTFTLEATGETLDAVTNGYVVLPDSTEVTITGTDDDKKASFADITFTKAGTYSFVIKEVKGDIKSLDYDEHEVTVTVNVVDNDAGKLVAAVPTYNGSMTFTNVYTPAVTAALEGTKELSGRTLDEEEFSFQIKALTEGAPMPAMTTVTNGVGTDAAKIAFGAITYTKAGTYEYEITEVKGDLAGIKYDEGTVKATVEVTYDSATGILTPVVSYEKTGGNGGTGFVFKNEYITEPTDPVNISAQKTVTPTEGHTFTMNGGDFTFEIVPAPANPVSDPIGRALVSNLADGSVKFADAQYAEAGTYVYTIREVDGSRGGITYDPSVYEVTVVVTDNEAAAKLNASVSITKNGIAADSITFDNGYTAQSTTALIHGHKNLNGGHKDLSAGEFQFTISAAEGTPMPAVTTVTNDATGLFQFDAITYTVPGEYAYTITEVNEGKAGVTYDGTVYTVTVSVTDDGNGELKATVNGVINADGTPAVVYNNTYTPAAACATFGGTKNLTGRDQNAGEFAFELLDSTGTVISEAENNADGTFAFDQITFTEAGNYYYTIVEKDTKVEGVTYDLTSSYGVKVVVTDDYAGQLHAETTYYLNDEQMSAVTFNNSYKAASTSIQLGAAKVLNGRDMVAGEFKFILEDEDGNQMYAENTEDGVILFEEISYSEAGTYVYTVYEEEGTLENVTYDDTEYTVTVEVEDDLAGHLTATTTIQKDGETVEAVEFVNEYENPGDPDDPDDPDNPDVPKDPDKPDDSKTPETPNKPGTSSDGVTDSTSKAVQTGDSTNIVIYLVLIVAAAAAIIAVLVVKKKSGKKR